MLTFFARPTLKKMSVDMEVDMQFDTPTVPVEEFISQNFGMDTTENVEIVVNDKYPNLDLLLKDVFAEYEAQGPEKKMSKANTLISILRRNHYWPYLQVKHYFDRSGLTLLHNTYRRDDVDHFKELYNECRSVVLDLDAPLGQNVVVSLANSTPTLMHVKAYEVFKQEGDVCEQSYEGTVVFVYYHKDKWHFSTTSCPSVNSSRYRHPEKTHGTLLNEILASSFPAESLDASRDAFAATLDPKNSYSFILVHHENAHLVNHSNEFGENYGALVHLSTRDRVCDMMLDLQLPQHRLNYPFMRYPIRFQSPDAAIAWLNAENPAHTYGFVVKRGNDVLRVCPIAVYEKDEEDLGNPNMWMNMLYVYKQNKTHFRVDDYLEKYHAKWKQVNPGNHGYVINTAFKAITDILYHLYRETTYYNKHTKRYNMNKAIDNSLSPIVRFHLAQLRFIQTSTHSFAAITHKAVYHYLCFHVTMKNMRMLIRYFSSNTIPQCPIEPRVIKCLITLDQELSKRA